MHTMTEAYARLTGRSNMTEDTKALDMYITKLPATLGRTTAQRDISGEQICIGPSGTSKKKIFMNNPFFEYLENNPLPFIHRYE